MSTAPGPLTECLKHPIIHPNSLFPIHCPQSLADDFGTADWSCSSSDGAGFVWWYDDGGVCAAVWWRGWCGDIKSHDPAVTLLPRGHTIPHTPPFHTPDLQSKRFSNRLDSFSPPKPYLIAEYLEGKKKGPFFKSENLAKTESLLIFVEQKLSSGPMCVPLMSVDIGSFTARPTIFRKLSHFKSWWHEKSFVCWTWTNRNLLKYSGVPIGTCQQMVGKASHVCIWCHHANRALGKGGMRLQLRSDPCYEVTGKNAL